jgi:hypothetical protein
VAGDVATALQHLTQDEVIEILGMQSTALDHCRHDVLSVLGTRGGCQGAFARRADRGAGRRNYDGVGAAHE